jgi:glucokinase
MILQGTSITCMELGMTRLSSHTNASGGGLVGTLEAEASRLAVAAEAAKAAYRGEAPTILREAGTDISKIRSSTLAQAIEHDPVVKAIAVQAAETIGIATANLIHLLAPERVILGGGLVEAMQELFVSIVSKMARKSVLAPYRDTFEVVPAKLGDDAGAMGAAAWVEHQVMEKR